MVLQCSDALQLDILLPKDAHEIFLEKLKGKDELRYAKVYMKLSDIVEGDFFSNYVKTGMSSVDQYDSPTPTNDYPKGMCLCFQKAARASIPSSHFEMASYGSRLTRHPSSALVSAVRPSQAKVEST